MLQALKEFQLFLFIRTFQRNAQKHYR